MRVIAGSARGTKLLSVPGSTTRPILARVKTSLFDILRPRIHEIELFLDLFAGSGSVGIEALSQGAKRAVFCDLEQAATQTIKENLEKTHLADRAEVRKTDAFGYLRHTSKSFDLIYVAPPQYEGVWLEALQKIAEKPQLLSENGQVIAQIDPKEAETVSFQTLSLAMERTYGNTQLLFFSRS